MNYFLPIFFGLAPSIIWLSYFLRKDVHPESNKMVLKIFFLGALTTIPAALTEIGIEKYISGWAKLYPNFSVFFYIFLAIGFVEEFSKYLIVKEKVLRNSEFDEPVDAMLYMIIAALGFAAAENIMVLLPKERPFLFSETAAISSFRFVGATFLHALCSGTVGYFLALSFYKIKRGFWLVASGISIAALLHGFFNIFIITIDGSLAFYEGETRMVNSSSLFFSLVALTVLLAGLAIFVSAGFKKVKKLKSICHIK